MIIMDTMRTRESRYRINGGTKDGTMILKKNGDSTLLFTINAKHFRFTRSACTLFTVREPPRDVHSSNSAENHHGPRQVWNL